MSKSILHRKDGTCFLCQTLHSNMGHYTWTEEHHVIFGRGRRKKSEHYGLKVYLCNEHHKANGKESPHGNETIRDLLSEIAQITFESKHDHELWMKEFGENYIGRDNNT